MFISEIGSNFVDVQKWPYLNPDYDHTSTHCGGCVRATEIFFWQKALLNT